MSRKVVLTRKFTVSVIVEEKVHNGTNGVFYFFAVLIYMQLKG